LKIRQYDRYIYRIQGKGTFISERKEEQDYAGSNIGFSGEMIGQIPSCLCYGFCNVGVK